MGDVAAPIITPADRPALRSRRPRLEEHLTWKHALSGVGALVAAAAGIAVWLLAQGRSNAMDEVAPVKATVEQLDKRLVQEHRDHQRDQTIMRQEIRDVHNDLREYVGKPPLPPLSVTEGVGQ